MNAIVNQDQRIETPRITYVAVHEVTQKSMYLRFSKKYYINCSYIGPPTNLFIIIIASYTYRV